jgi:hypothetical protein
MSHGMFVPVKVINLRERRQIGLVYHVKLQPLREFDCRSR